MNLFVRCNKIFLDLFWGFHYLWFSRMLQRSIKTKFLIPYREYPYEQPNDRFDEAVQR